MIVNVVKLWGSNSRVPSNVKSLLSGYDSGVNSEPRIIVTVWFTTLGQIDLFENYSIRLEHLKSCLQTN